MAFKLTVHQQTVVPNYENTVLVTDFEETRGQELSKNIIIAEKEDSQKFFNAFRTHRTIIYARHIST
ncbi:unnamed protein product [Nesidiocoris tenuis]|uniref:Uncharacterized protein n=1 Tax=Nesidiocoris tenuis TaxID=355587 RepID=A0A6H5GP07_9HEMI|nr:unnamed protein product [Nesidiocoris tenuis]